MSPMPDLTRADLARIKGSCACGNPIPSKRLLSGKDDCEACARAKSRAKWKIFRVRVKVEPELAWGRDGTGRYSRRMWDLGPKGIA